MRQLLAFLIFAIFLFSACYCMHNSNHQSSHFSSSSTSGHYQSTVDGNTVIVNTREDADGKPDTFISVSHPKIIIDGEYFTCAGLVCPRDAFKCVVTSEVLDKNDKMMKTVAECFDENGESLDKTEFEEKNPHPREEPPYSRHVSVDRDSGISIEDTKSGHTFNINKMTKEQQEDVANKINEQTQRMHEQIRLQQEQFQQQMNAFQNHMHNTFGKGFPFGNNQYQFQNNFPFQNGFPFANNFPFQNGFPFYHAPQPYPNMYHSTYSQNHRAPTQKPQIKSQITSNSQDSAQNRNRNSVDNNYHDYD